MTKKNLLPSYPLRLEPELKERLEQAAREHDRTLRAEIVRRLEASFRTAVAPTEPALTQKLVIHLAPDQTQYIGKLAERAGISMGDMARMLMQHALLEKEIDRLRREVAAAHPTPAEESTPTPAPEAAPPSKD